MAKNIIAQIIGEKSGGMTALEIWSYRKNGDLNKLLYSTEYFSGGCTAAGYLSGLADAIDCCLDSQKYTEFDGCAFDDSTGKIVQYDNSKYTGVVASYDSKSKIWTAGDRFGQSDEILDALILAGLVEQDDAHNPECKVAIALVNQKFKTAQ